MQRTLRVVVAIAACVWMAGAGQLAAQQPPSPQQPLPVPQPPGLQVLMAQGELVKVDSEARIFAMRTADGTEMHFRYTDATKVTGAEEGAEGLAAKEGSHLIVKYTEQGRTNIATEIEVQGKR